MAETPNHGYAQPERGDENWHDPLNTNFEEIDIDIELRDSGPPSPDNYTPTEGAKYLDTSTGVVYTADGNAWSAAFAEARYTPPGDANASGSVVFGHPLNSIGSNVVGATIAGGGRDTELAGTPPQPNSVTARYGTVGGGFDNTASAGKATVGGGAVNTAGGTNATVGGGVTNEATGESATVAGGSTNDATGTNSTVGGGAGNTASGQEATVAGGGGNTADSNRATAGGGQLNTANSDNATVAGGFNNTASGSASTVGGGGNNGASASNATVAGGRENETSGQGAAVGGGYNNRAVASYATIAGGGPRDTSSPDATNNVVHDNYGTVAGGANNQAGDPNASGTDNAEYAAVGGGRGNEATRQSTAIGGGERNVASATNATVGGGRKNEATATTTTIAGGQENVASGFESAVGGGGFNEASANRAVVGGGGYNDARAEYATIAGGGPTDVGNPDTTNNVVYDAYGTVGGGGNNQAGSDDGSSQDPTNAQYATVAGGQDNDATGQNATVGGGNNNTAGGSFGGTGNDTDQTVAGGSGNEASAEAAAVGGGSNNEASGSFAAVPGGEDNAAQADYSFAAGRRAKAQNPGSFVFADSNDTDVTTSGDDEFVVQAAGGVGLSTIADLDLKSNVHLSGIGGNDQTSPSSYSVLVENNTNTLVDTGIALAVQMDIDSPDGDDNYIGFFDSTGAATGAIEGSSSGDGINLNSTSADYAEYMPRLDAEERIEPGDVVGVVGDAVTRETAEADRAMVVSDQPLVTGNAPGVDSEARADHEIVAFVGQVPVNVRGSVAAGDLLVPSGRADGTAEAIAPAAWQPGNGPLVGRALETDDTEGVSRVRATVGVDDPTVLGERLDEYRSRVERLEDENEQLRDENERLRERLAAVEAHLGLDESESAQGVADD